MRLVFQIVWLLAIAATVAGGWWWFAEREGAAARDKVKARRSAATLVLVEPVILSTDRRVVRAIGTGRALQSAALYPSVSGEVIKVAFEAEQKVKTGQPLIRLDDEDQRLAVRLAKVAVNEADRQARRLKKLAPSGNVAQATLDTATAELESAQLRLAQAKADLKDRTVFAPFDGIIGLTDVDKGDRVTPDTLIATLDDRSSLFVEFNVSEDAAAYIRPGVLVSMTAWTLPDRTFTGIVSAMGSRIDPITRSLKIRAQIANREDAVRPGTSFAVNVEISGSTYPTVREVAVLWSRDGAYIWRVTDGKVEKVFVKVIRRESGRVLIEGDLHKGDVIVVEGVQGLRPGRKVKATPREQNSATKTDAS
ncbi:MAG: efflux RND transporter periplasmic adaptor subunit [Alphaproteobacteria bacterium]|nr:efflux RND transporter periplasmic adaptor subunit [Alphaproteobacteria bacterium]